MSTIALDYPNRIQVRRRVNIRWIVILIAGLALVASVILVVTSAAPKMDSSSGVVVVLVPIAPVVDAASELALPSTTVTPAPDPVVIAVPVPEPPTP